MYMYIYIYMDMLPVSAKENTPWENVTHRNVSFINRKIGDRLDH